MRKASKKIQPGLSENTPRGELQELKKQLAESREKIRRLLSIPGARRTAEVTIDHLTTEAELILHDILRTTPVFVFTQDSSLRYTWAFSPPDGSNGRARVFVGKTDAEVFSPPNAGKLTAIKQLSLSKGERLRRDLVIHGDDGEWIYELTIEPMRNAAGEISGISGTVMDVTERRLADREIRLLAQTVASTRDLVLITDLTGSLLFTNDSFLELFGYSDEEVLGKDIGLIGIPPAGSTLRNAIGRAIDEGGWHGETVGLTRDNVPIPLDVWVSTVRNDSDKPVAFVAVARDISAMKRAQRNQTAIYRIAAAVSSTEHLQELYGAIHEIIRELMPARNLYIAVLDGRREMLEFPYFVDEFDTTPVARPPGRGLTEYVIRTASPLLASPEVFQDLVDCGAVESIGAPSLDWLGVPLSTAGGVFGALVVQSYSPDIRFGSEHLDILSFVSTQISMAIERKRAEESVRNSEQRYRGLFEDATIPLWEEDASEVKKEILRLRSEGVTDFRRFLNEHPGETFRWMRMIRCVDVNRATLDLFGAKSKDEMRARMGEIFCPDGEDQMREELIAFAEGRHPFAMESTNRTLDGRTINVAVRLSIAPGHEDTLSKLIVSTADITERKHMEQELQRERNLIRSIFESSPDAITITDMNGLVTDCNAAKLGMLGISSREDLIGTNDLETIVEQDRKRARAHAAEAVERGVVHDAEYRLLTRDRREIPIELSTSLMRDELGRPLYFVSISKDITARKAAEQALRESEARLQTVFESLPFDLWVCDTHGRFVMQNPVAIANWGYQIGKLPAETLISGDVVELWERNNMKAMTGELVAAEAQFSHHGRVVHLYTIVAPIWRDGEIMGVLGLNIDVTDRKTLQQQLLQSQKLESIGTLAGGIAHDFNNILGIIMGHAAILPDISHDGSKLARSVASIQKAGNRGAGLVRQILTFARKADVVFEPVNLNEVATELSRMFEETFPRTINIVLELEPGLPAIQADKTQVHQTILNLCVNARDAMQNGGTLTISTRLAWPSEVAGHPPKTYACLTVGDTGTGMDEETKSRIFEPFFTTKELGKGTGLGLSVVYGIMESHHGFITIDSAPGSGTRFLLYFPGKEGTPGREEPPAIAPAAESRGTETLLIVEDEDLLCELLKSSLESAGYTVLSASDGEQALSIFRSLADDIAMVVTDIGLPRMSGRDLFIALRKIRPELKVVIATGYIEPEAKTELLALGACGFLQKPYLPSQVAHAVREALKAVTVR